MNNKSLTSSGLYDTGGQPLGAALEGLLAFLGGFFLESGECRG